MNTVTRVYSPNVTAALAALATYEAMAKVIAKEKAARISKKKTKKGAQA